MSELLQHSKFIMDEAISQFQPKAIVLMFSGGDDSLVAYNVAKELGYKFDAVIHGNTRTGLIETTKFAVNHTEFHNDKIIIADAGKSYEKYVLRKGFFGVGDSAHNMAYHILKAEHFRKAVSHNLRRRRHNFPVLFVNGARRLESKRREVTMVNPIKIDPSMNNNIWVNIINEWTKEDCINYLEGNNIKRNPVSVALCRSGECMCGTMQTMEDYTAAKEFSPSWGNYMDSLRKEVRNKFGFDWGENFSKQKHMELKGQKRIDFQPMCTGCKIENSIK